MGDSVSGIKSDVMENDAGGTGINTVKTMEIRYERSLIHAEMILPAEQNERKKYFRRMILENRMRGFVPVSFHQADREMAYYYRISGLISLKEYLEHDFLRLEFLKQLIFSLCRCTEALEEYLLAEDCLLVDPCTIFVEERDEPEFLFCLYPDGGRTVREDIHELLKYLMGRTDPEDERCAALCYRLYELLQKENFYLGEFMTALEEREEEKTILLEPEKKKGKKQLFASRRNGGIIKPARR